MDMKTIAAQLRDEAKRLQFKARTLLDAAAILEAGEATPDFQQALPLPASPTPKARTRLDQLMDFFAAHGPKPAREILAMTKMSRGTLYTLLKDRKMFVQDEEKRWKPAEAEKSPA